MNADAFRYFYDYHFAEKRKLWKYFVLPLTQEQFLQPSSYSVGSVRNQCIHLIDVETSWFSELRGVEIPDWHDPTAYEDRAVISTLWDELEQMMRGYLATLRDDMLFEKPFPPGEDENLIVWQVLLHVVNHATDHRAQILRLINEMGVETPPQDFMFYVYDHP